MLSLQRTKLCRKQLSNTSKLLLFGQGKGDQAWITNNTPHLSPPPPPLSLSKNVSGNDKYEVQTRFTKWFQRYDIFYLSNFSSKD